MLEQSVSISYTLQDELVLLKRQNADLQKLVRSLQQEVAFPRVVVVFVSVLFTGKAQLGSVRLQLAESTQKNVALEAELQLHGGSDDDEEHHHGHPHLARHSQHMETFGDLRGWIRFVCVCATAHSSVPFVSFASFF